MNLTGLTESIPDPECQAHPGRNHKINARIKTRSDTDHDRLSMRSKRDLSAGLCEHEARTTCASSIDDRIRPRQPNLLMNYTKNCHHYFCTKKRKKKNTSLIVADIFKDRIKMSLYYTAIFLIFSLSTLVHGQPPPPPAGFLDFDNLPVTRFSCEGKVIGGYYADVETGCQMFHVCTLGQKDEVQDIKFLCLNGTVFDQETRVCERVDEVDCSQAEKFYDLNLDLYVPHTVTTTTTTPLPTTTRTTTVRTTPAAPVRATSPKSAHLAKQFANSFNTNSNGFKVGSTAPERNADNEGGKGFSTYAYFHRTPHSVISSGYNSQLRQSYLINHQQGNNANAAPASSTAPIVVETRSSSTSHGHSSPTGRKVGSPSSGSAAKTIVYTSTKPSVTSRQHVVSSTTPKQQQQYHHQSSSTVKSVTQSIVDPNSASLQVEYPEDDEYYDEGEDYAALVAGGGTGPSAHDAATILQNNQKIDLSDRAVNRVSKNISPATALYNNAHVKQQQAPKPSPISLLQHHVIADNSTEEPYYYEDEYEEHIQPQQQQQTQGASSRTAPVEPSSSSSASESDSPEYYDENDEPGLDVNSHHFSHVDVPRIVFKPNEPRVLVTNGKPFLPRLRRQSYYTHHLEPGSSLWNYYIDTVSTFNQNSNNNRDSNLNHDATPLR